VPFVTVKQREYSKTVKQGTSGERSIAVTQAFVTIVKMIPVE
jgi:hypothetical protein